MKNFTCLVVLALFLTSCSRYQYLSIAGKEMAQNERNELVSENDTLLVTYNFNGYNCPVNITVFNKSSRPVYVDWKRSALISNGKATSYYSPDYHINGTVSGYSINWTNGVSEHSTGIALGLSGQDGVAFIPPQSYITKTPLTVSDQLFVHGLDKATKQVITESDVTYAVRKKEFDAANSPLTFRSYITLQFAGSAKDTTLEHTFHVREIVQTSTSPKHFIVAYTGRGDTYYVGKATGFGTGVAAVGIVGGAVAAGVVAAENNKQQQ